MGGYLAIISFIPRRCKFAFQAWNTAGRTGPLYIYPYILFSIWGIIYKLPQTAPGRMDQRFLRACISSLEHSGADGAALYITLIFFSIWGIIYKLPQTAPDRVDQGLEAKPRAEIIHTLCLSESAIAALSSSGRPCRHSAHPTNARSRTCTTVDC